MRPIYWLLTSRLILHENVLFLNVYTNSIVHWSTFHAQPSLFGDFARITTISTLSRLKLFTTCNLWSPVCKLLLYVLRCKCFVWCLYENFNTKMCNFLLLLDFYTNFIIGWPTFDAWRSSFDDLTRIAATSIII